MRVTIPFLFFFLFQAFAWAQPFTKAYQSGNVGDQSVLTFSQIAVHPDGGYLVSGGGIQSNKSHITKLDSIGDVVWSVIPEQARSITKLMPLENGNTIAIGINTGYSGYFDGSVMMIDIQGGIIFERIWGTPDEADGLSNASVLSDGNILCIGTSTDENTFEDQIIMFKMSADGTIIWERAWDNAGIVSYNQIFPDEDGGCFLVGNALYGDTYSIISHFDALGDEIWHRLYDFNGEVSPYLATRQSDGSIIIGGASGASPNGSFNQITLVSFSANGDYQWSKDYIGQATGNMLGMHVDDNDSILVVGVDNNQFFPVLNNDNVILKFSPQGDLASTTYFGSDSSDFMQTSLLVGNKLVLGGFTRETNFHAGDGYLAMVFLDTVACGITKEGFTAGVTTTAPTLIDYTATEIAPIVWQDNADLTSLVGIMNDTLLCGEIDTVEIVIIDNVFDLNCLESVEIKNAFSSLQTLENDNVDVARITVVDVSGRIIVQTSKTNEVIDWYNSSSSQGMYFYQVIFEGCGAKQMFSDKWLLLR